MNYKGLSTNYHKLLWNIASNPFANSSCRYDDKFFQATF